MKKVSFWLKEFVKGDGRPFGYGKTSPQCQCIIVLNYWHIYLNNDFKMIAANLKNKFKTL